MLAGSMSFLRDLVKEMKEGRFFDNRNEWHFIGVCGIMEYQATIFTLDVTATVGSSNYGDPHSFASSMPVRGKYWRRH